MNPSFEVPAQYFYALAAGLPPTVTAEVRYRLATMTDERTVLDHLRKAREDGVIEDDPNVTLEMAARRLRSLGGAKGGTVVCAPGVGFALVQAYADYEWSTPPPIPDDPGEDVAAFWAGVIGSPALASAHLELVLSAVAFEPDPRPLIGRVADPPPAGEGFLLDDVRNIDPEPWPGSVPSLDYGDWQAVFSDFAEVLPAITAPGTLEERIGAFVRRLRQFFDVASTGIGPAAAAPGTPPVLASPSFDPIVAFVFAYTSQPAGAGWAWGDPFDDAAFAAALAIVPLDGDGRRWLQNAARTVNDLTAVTSVGFSPELQFSLAEGLFARGFTRTAQIGGLTIDDFTTAVIGTPVYPFAAAVHARAGGLVPPGVESGPFSPVNDGSLVNCIPPCGASPLGAIAYLHDLLLVATDATCDGPGDAETIGTLVSGRRGDLGDLAASCENEQTPLPVVDLVNESLERVVSTGLAVGAVHDTGSPPGHDAATYFAATSEQSSPATPVAQPGAYATLEADFSSPVLPYSQQLDVNRSYLDAIGTTRFDVMRRFRKHITEFVLDPDGGEPPAFPRHLWRRPVRIDIAREYLRLDPEEHAQLFTSTPSGAFLMSLYGFVPGAASWRECVVRLDEFLVRTGLEYCEFLELWRSGYVRFHDAREGEFPECEPCYLDAHEIVFDELSPDDALAQLAVFIRLWRKLHTLPGAGYSFAELRDICEVLGLFLDPDTLNPNFVRELAAFQMLRDDFGLPLRDAGDVAPGTGADRTHLLALWAPWAGVEPRKWSWAVDVLVDALEPPRPDHAHDEHESAHRPDFRKLLVRNLDALSLVAGFDPAVADHTWHRRPTHTLRFAEQVAKVWASAFGVGELLYLVTADEHIGGDDPFPLQDENEAIDDPLEHPDQEHDHWLWELRSKLLQIEADEDLDGWTWSRVTSALSQDLHLPGGAALDPLVAFGKRFFPSVLEAEGVDVPPAHRRFEVPLAGSASAMWNTPPSPFFYDDSGPGPALLQAVLPLRAESVLTKLSRVRPLTGPERAAVRDLWSRPWLALAEFAYLFPSLGDAHAHLVEEADERARWEYFRRCVAVFAARCRAAARHLADHVDAGIGETSESTEGIAWAVLCRLLADENSAAQWELDDGTRPPVTWSPPPVGGAFATLAGLVGVGLRAEYTVDDGATLLWRDLRGPLTCFDEVANEWNAPVPTILPALDADLPAEQQEWASVRNGIGIHAATARRLGGIQPYCVRLEGVLLVERDGTYQFRAGAPTPDDVPPDLAAVRNRRWRVVLRRGQKEWVLLTHEWPEAAECPVSTALSLRQGAYDLSIELVQCAPTDDDLEDEHVQHTGFQLKYQGPDTGDRLLEVPRHRLYVSKKDGTLADGVDESIGSGALEVLRTSYVSTLRDVRRTYQRAFKAVLFARRFALSAEPYAQYAQSELGFLLDHPDRFAGLSFYGGAPWTAHRVGFDPNLLPLRDPYLEPAAGQDDRAHPSVQRRRALFDQWERIYDYTMLRAEAAKAPEHPAWLLFDEAFENHPDNPAQLLRHLGIDITHAAAVVRFWNAYDVTADDLVDERWATRVWRADQELRKMLAAFYFTDPRLPRPALWASDDPGAPGAGNEDLTSVLREGFIDNGEPRRYADLQTLNEGLRERARRALVAHLTGMERVALPWGGHAATARDLSDLLLIDVESGLCQRASRVEEAITAVQTYVQRARLGLEPAWAPGPGFTALWDGRFASFHTWAACTRRSLYAENWQEWVEREEAVRSEAFRFLEQELRRATVTIARPGGLEYWAAEPLPAHPGLVLLQERVASTIRILDGPREGLDLRGRPDASGQRSWLTRLGREHRDPDDDVPEPEPRDPDDRGEGPGGQPVPAPPPRGEVALVAREVAAGPEAGTARFDPGSVPAPGGTRPLWLEAAIRVGARFLRVQAAGEPPAATRFDPPASEERDPCCHVCGCVHDALVDEYYFWLADRRWYDEVEQAADWPGWHDTTSLPGLLAWPDEPVVHLMWSWVHNGDIGAPRRSTHGVRMPLGTAPGSIELELVGRSADSLVLRVVGGVAPPGYPAAPDPGFRYDIAVDDATVLPEVPGSVAPPGFPGGLPAYPFYAHFDAGAPLFPLSPFSEAFSVATTLRTHCQFEAALKWYSTVHDPLRGDNNWCPGRRQPPPPTDRPPDGDETGPVGVVALVRGEPTHVRTGRGERDGHEPSRPGDSTAPRPRPDHDRHDGHCCRHAGAPPEVARRRAITLTYVETLLEWGDCLMAKNSPQASQQARLVFDSARRVLGATPRTVRAGEHGHADGKGMTVATFVPAGASLNPRLLSVYERLEDRLALIHRCNSVRRLRNGVAPRDMPYFGNSPARDGWNVVRPGCECGADECCCPTSPYRFVVLVRRAEELAAVARGFGAALLAAYEKGDAEHLAHVRAGHERQITTLLRDMRRDQWRDADWQVQALQKTKEIAQTRRRYYGLLVTNGLIPGDLDYQALTNAATGALTAATITEAIGTVLGVIPDIFVGTVNFTQLPIGTKLAHVFQGIARISSLTSQILTTTAGLRLTEAGWVRRDDEWRHQIDVFDLEIEQIERQILGAERRRSVALRELNSQEQAIANANEVLDTLRDKFTSHELLLWLQSETAALHRAMYELARCAAEQAERAFNFERGFAARRFLPDEPWENLRDGLLAGERLELAVRQMDSAYHQQNVREYELVKHVSLRLHFPGAFLALKLTGTCVVELPEWLFDLDYPGHYMRRVKSVSVTIPVVAGPYTGVHCRLTLLSSSTRVDPRLLEPLAPCCPPEPPPRHEPSACRCWGATAAAPTAQPVVDETTSGYVVREDDPRIVRQYSALEAIATSSGQNDGGLFQLNFQDERYLPFEFAGAVSRWLVELPPENNNFSPGSLSDVVLHLSFTAREGGDALRAAAAEVSRARLPGNGERVFEVGTEMPDEWSRFVDSDPRRLEVRLSRQMFPYLTGDRVVQVTAFDVYIEAPGAGPSAHHELAFVVSHRPGCHRATDDDHDFECTASESWPGLFRGSVDVPVAPITGNEPHHLGTLVFETAVEEVRRIYLVVRYDLREDVGVVHH